MNKNRLIVISMSEFPGTAGDTSNYLEMLKALGERGLDVILFCPIAPQSKAFDMLMQENGTKVLRIPFRAVRLANIRNRNFVLSAMQYCVFMVVETLTLLFSIMRYQPKTYLIRHSLLTLQMAPILFLLGIKGIADGEIISDSIDDALILPAYFKKTLSSYERKAIKYYSYYVCSTLEQKKQAILFGFPEKRIMMRKIAIDISMVPQYDLKQIQPATFGYFGALEKWQGVDFLIRAISKAVEKNKKVKLYVIGGGSMEDDLRRLAGDLKVSQNIVFYGRVQRETLWKDCFRKFRVTIIPRPRLNVPANPIKLAEALAAGKPVIATNVAGIKESVTLEDGVVLVEPDDEISLSNAILELSNNDELLTRLRSSALESAKRFKLDPKLDPIIKKIDELLRSWS